MQKLLAISALAVALLAVGDQAVRRTVGPVQHGQALACEDGGEVVRAPGGPRSWGEGSGEDGDCLTRSPEHGGVLPALSRQAGAEAGRSS